ncbi:MAG: tRNA lysidine(34) synthetase TilS [Chloroflexota bacterium]
MTVPEEALDQAVRAAQVEPGAGLIVAVSGGADSVALLDSLDRVNRENSRRWTLRVAHINHQMRGPESDDDEQFVRRLADTMRLPIVVTQVDSHRHARERHLSLETAARQQRYAALEGWREEYGARAIVLAHNLDDQAETVLLRLLRGTGLRGLPAMQYASGSLVRPFLGVRRHTIRKAIVARGLAYRDDSSNVDPRFTRNALRSTVLPALESIQPHAVEAIARASVLLGHDSAFLSTEVERVMPFLAVTREGDRIVASLPVWRSLNQSLKGHALHFLVRQALGHARDVHDAHIQLVAAVLESSDRAILADQLPHGLEVRVTGDTFSIGPPCRDNPGVQGVRTLTVPGGLDLPHGRLSADVLYNVDGQALARYLAVAGPLHLFADADRLGAVLHVRGRRPGDRLKPLGMQGTRKVQDILTDRKISRDKRGSVVVVENERHVVWLVGMTLDGRIGVTASTRRVAHIAFRPDSGGIP